MHSWNLCRVRSLPVSIQGVQAVGRVIIETEALAVVQAIYSSTYDLSATVNIVTELRNLLSLNFISWQVQYRCRTSSCVAHKLAALGSICSLDDDPILDLIPLCIQSAIADDSALSE